jgi:hypothetical protein
MTADKPPRLTEAELADLRAQHLPACAWLSAGPHPDEPSRGWTCNCALSSLLDEVSESRAEKKRSRLFTIMGGPSIPWEMIAPHEAQALKNHGQTLERLNQRSGLDQGEALATLDGKGLWDVQRTREEARAELQRRLDAWNDNVLRKEIARLREALEKIVGPNPDGWRGQAQAQEAYLIARAALEGSK